MSQVRPPAVAGMFYPQEPPRLRAAVEQFLAEAADAGPVPRAVIAPHAGYVYSGPIAASAYARLQAAHTRIRRVLLLGPAHRVAVRGIAASSAAAFATPLGEIPLDRPAIEQMLAGPHVHVQDEAHAPEHGLEVHLPFLQVVLGDFQLIPLLVGRASPASIAGLLAPYASAADSLLIVSSDLSHYQHYDRACRLDHQTSEAIGRLEPLAPSQACGQQAINGLLSLARSQGWQVEAVDVRNSGDTGGSRRQVVGYGAYLFYA